MNSTRSKARRRRQRGQAMLETALGSILFIIIVVGGIHFAELGMLSVKATEASSAAIWDATARRVHHYDPGDGELKTDTGEVADAAQERIRQQYQDFDGRESSSGLSPQLVFTRGSNLQVTCTPIQGDLMNDLGRLDLHNAVRGVFGNDDHGGVRCRAVATASLIPGRAPVNYLEGEGGWLAGPLLNQTAIEFCGTGRAWNGNCNDGTPILLGDWGLADTRNREHEECDLYDRAGCDNPGYYKAAERIFNDIGIPSGAGSALARAVVGRSPIDEGEFWFAFKGNESGFKQQLNGTHLGRDEFIVTPGGTSYQQVPEYDMAYARRVDCWLGMPCKAY